jgi:hypothetical protein
LAVLLAEQTECSDMLVGRLTDSGMISAPEADLLLSQFLLEREQRLSTSPAKFETAARC